MRFPRSVLLALALSIVAPAIAAAQCPHWTYGPFWRDFLTNGANATIVSAATWDPDGAGPLQAQLVIAGSFNAIQGTPCSGIAARSPETGAWNALGSGMSGTIYCMTAYNGELIAAGTLATAGGSPVNEIARWNGSVWQPLGSGITAAVYVRAMTVYNGELIVAGTFATAGGSPASNIAAWNGSSWHALGAGTSGTVAALGIWNGNLIAGGAFTTAGGVTVNNVAQWDGSSWSAMNTGLFASFNGFQPFNGLLYAICGTTVSGTPSSFIANWNGSSWHQSPTFVRTTFNAITAKTGAVYVGGSSTTGQGGPAAGVFQTDGTNLFSLAGSITGTTNGLVIFSGELVDVGAFTAADGRLANRIARWDGTSWGTFGGGVATVVNAFAPFGSGIVSGGDFHQYLPTYSEAHHIVLTTNGVMTPFGTGMDGPVTALKSYTSGSFVNSSSNLVAGGTFGHAGGVAVTNIARWTQSQVVFTTPAWIALGAGLNGRVRAIERFNNQVYAAGDFTASGATTVNFIARFNETTKVWESIGGTDGPVYALKVFGSFLYVGGSMSNSGGVATGGLARWNGTTWSNVGGFFGGSVYALETYGNLLAIGGAYPGFGGSPNIAAYDGAAYSLLGSGGTNGAVRTLHSTGARLYAGGEFTSLGSLPINRVGYWDGSWHDTRGGVDNTVLALSHYHNFVHTGGTFVNVQGGAFIGTPVYAEFDETGLPQFYRNPFSQTVNVGDNATFTAVPDSGSTFAYTQQWVFNGAPLSDGPTGFGSTISGSHSEILNITNVSAHDIGTYQAVLMNGCGSDSSFAAQLTGPTAVGDPRVSHGDVLQAIGPNPAASATQVSFSLAHAGHVRLSVLDLAGRRVRVIDAGSLAAGEHRALWDVHGDDGARVRAGMYFIGLEIDGRSIANRRVTIVR